jgi:hypothetical protein
VRFVPASVLPLFFAFGLAGCGPKIAERNIDAVNRMYDAAERSGKSLSIKEVEAVLGPPKESQPFPIEMQTTKVLQGIRYYYEQDGQMIELHFIDNKLIRRVQRPGEQPPPDESERRIMPPQPAAK